MIVTVIVSIVWMFFFIYISYHKENILAGIVGGFSITACIVGLVYGTFLFLSQFKSNDFLMALVVFSTITLLSMLVKKMKVNECSVCGNLFIINCCEKEL